MSKLQRASQATPLQVIAERNRTTAEAFIVAGVAQL